MANPHVSIVYKDPDGRKTEFKRAAKVLPEEPKEIKPHPHGIELGTLINMMNQTSARRVSTFLRGDFSRVSERNAEEICEKARINTAASPKRVARQQAEKLLKAIRDTKLRNPPLDCITPIGEAQIKVGIKSQIKADFLECVTRAPAVYRGIPFVIEAALAYGGDLPAEKPARLMRFANRVPLLYQTGGCIVTQSVQSMNWRQYGLDQPNGSLPIGPMLVFVHMASPWVPFTSESKEAVAGYPEIEKEIGLALQECGRKLRIFLNKRRRHIEESRKRQYIEKYIPHIGEALQGMLSFPDKDKEKLIKRLTHILEKSRKD